MDHFFILVLSKFLFYFTNIFPSPGEIFKNLRAQRTWALLMDNEQFAKAKFVLSCRYKHLLVPSDKGCL